MEDLKKRGVSTKGMEERIEKLEEAMVMVDKEKIRVTALANNLAIFCGINVKNIGVHPHDSKIVQARRIFAKWGLENGIPGKVLWDYMGTNKADLSQLRKNFTRSFSKPDGKDIWNRWKIFMEERIQMSKEASLNKH